MRMGTGSGVLARHRDSEAVPGMGATVGGRTVWAHKEGEPWGPGTCERGAWSEARLCLRSGRGKQARQMSADWWALVGMWSSLAYCSCSLPRR